MKNRREHMYEHEKAGVAVVMDAEYEVRQSRKFKLACMIAVFGGIVCLSESSCDGGVLEMIAAAVFGGLLIGGIPYGWGIVSRMTDWLRFFLFLPLVGWLIYFAGKLFASAVVGVGFFIKEIFTRLQIIKFKEQKGYMKKYRK